MEKWTQDMHIMADSTERQTVSMHIITIVALFFLPGTFVAVREYGLSTFTSLPYGSTPELPCRRHKESFLTKEEQSFFDTGIVDFEPTEEHGFAKWKVNKAAITMFFVICVFLMFVTVGGWIFTLRKHRKSRERRTVVAGDA